MTTRFRFQEHTLAQAEDGGWLVREHLRPGFITRRYERPEFARMEIERCDRWGVCPAGRIRHQRVLKRKAAPRIAARPGRLVRR
jgi:hypothetical protein